MNDPQQELEAAHIYEMGFRDGYHIGYGNAIRNVEAVTDPVDTDAPMPLRFGTLVSRITNGTVESV